MSNATTLLQHPAKSNAQKHTGSAQKVVPEANSESNRSDKLATGLGDVRDRLERIECLLKALAEQRTAKEWYTTAEVAKIIGKGEYTVREYCRKGQLQAEKAANGRGWLISHEALTQLRNLGPTPEHRV
jgi:excisionase family DNA binding protein